jgi:hypothetical protein
MPWRVRLRDKDFIGNEGWDPEPEFEVREALTDTQELSHSAEVIIHGKDGSVDDVTVHEPSDPDEFPFNGVHGHHPELGEVFLFSGVPNEGEGRLIALYSAKNFGALPPFNDENFTGNGS